MRRTFAIKANGTRVASFQETETRTAADAWLIAGLWCKEHDASYLYGPEMRYEIEETVEPDHYLEGQRYVDSIDR